MNFAQLSYLLSLLTFKPYTLFQDAHGRLNAKGIKKGKPFLLHQEDSSQEVSAWKETLALKEVEVVYLYGVGLGFYPLELLSFLKQSLGRRLVILEDDLAAAAAFLNMQSAEQLLNHPQIDFRLITKKEQWPQVLEDLSALYPCSQVHITALKSSCPKRLQTIRLTLLRKITFFASGISEVLNYDKLCRNIFSNCHRLPSSFYVNALKGKFKGMPAIICGAGPSLHSSFEILKQMDDRALIIAGGSAITALSNQGIMPHFAIALDPNLQEYERLKNHTATQAAFLYGNRVHPDVFSIPHGPLGYIRSDTGGPAETWLENKLGLTGDPVGPDLGREALSVTTLATALSYELGCNPIILVGVDLAFTHQQRYVAGIVEDNALELEAMHKESRASEQLLCRHDRQGKPIYTLVKWVMESDVLSAFAARHKKCTFINSTDGGLGFKKIPYISLKEVAEKYCNKPQEIRKQVEMQCAQSSLSEMVTQDKIDALLEELTASIHRCLSLCQEMLCEIQCVQKDSSLPQETGKMVLYEMEFQEEVAYECLFQGFSEAIELFFYRTSPSQEEGAVFREISLQRIFDKWKLIQERLEAHLSFIVAQSLA